ncbi:hypothetical protein DQ354_10385 [Arthrobacter sp. AQ5-06]|nr:hypothetical protein DQ354_10385 [Arthrobacter sp. AQ5-06]
MVIGAMELRRLGVVTKPAGVIPNHMLEQFAREWFQIYPQTRILATSSNEQRRMRTHTLDSLGRAPLAGTGPVPSSRLPGHQIPDHLAAANRPAEAWMPGHGPVWSTARIASTLIVDDRDDSPL